MLANLVKMPFATPPSAPASAFTWPAGGRASCWPSPTTAPVSGEDRDRIYRRLSRAQQSRTTPGTGLGLALVKVIAELHGATVVALDNHPGLRVEVRLPATGG